MNEQPIHDPEARELVAKIEAGTAGMWTHGKPPYLQHILDSDGRVVCDVEDRNQAENAEAICAAHNDAPAIIRRLDARVAFLEKVAEQATRHMVVYEGHAAFDDSEHNDRGFVNLEGEPEDVLLTYFKEQAAKEKE